jgi:acetyltransferase-like isoleucine patch superfamily enzyme
MTINDNSKPLILLGSNAALWFITDICSRHHINVHGIIDSDYFGNKDHLDNIPVIDSELAFEDPEKLQYYKDNYNFFLVVNWTAQQVPVHIRDFNKRLKLIEAIEKYDLNCISLVDHSSVVHNTNVIGKNVLIDSFCCISAFNNIGDFTSIYAYAAIGHHNTIGRNCIIQRQSGVHAFNTLEENVYVGLSTQVFGDHLTLKKGTIIHPCLAVNRSTNENETVSMAGKDLRRIYPSIQEG